MGGFEIGDAGDESGGWGDVVATGFDFEAEVATGGGGELLVAGSEEFAERFEGHLGGRIAIIVGDTAAEADGIEVGEVVEEFGKFGGEEGEIIVEFGELGSASDVSVEHGDWEASGEGGIFDGENIFEPDAVFGAGSTGIAGIDMAVTEAGVNAEGNGATIAGAGEFSDLAWGSDIGEDAVLENNV